MAIPAKLTKRLVNALEPRDAPYAQRDTEIKGFLVRVENTGHKAFYFHYAFGGRREIAFNLGEYGNLSVEGARALAKVAAGDVAKGIDIQTRRKAERTQAVRDRRGKLEIFLTEVYEPDVRAYLKSAEIQIKRIRSDFVDYLGLPMTALHGLEIERLRRKWLKAGKKPRTINRDIDRIQGVLSRAVKAGVLDRHPLKGFARMLFDKAGRVRFLSAVEEAALRAALVTREDRLRAERLRYNTWRIERQLKPLPEREPDLIDNLKPMVLLALNTGMRRGELFSLKWADVDLEAGIVIVRAESAKSGQTRRIPLNSEAAKILATWREHKESAGGFVFPGADGDRLTNITKSWGGVTKLAQLKGFNFHDLRHSFASKLVQNGTDLNTVRTLLGHSQISTTLIYAHLAPDNLRAAVEKVAG